MANNDMDPVQPSHMEIDSGGLHFSNTFFSYPPRHQ